MPVQPTWGQPARLEGSNCCQESRARSSETDREVGRAHKVLLPGKAQARRSFPHSSSIAESSLAVLLCDGGNVVVRNFGLAGLSARCCTSTLLGTPSYQFSLRVFLAPAGWGTFASITPPLTACCGVPPGPLLGTLLFSAHVACKGVERNKLFSGMQLSQHTPRHPARRGLANSSTGTAVAGVKCKRRASTRTRNASS